MAKLGIIFLVVLMVMSTVCTIYALFKNVEPAPDTDIETIETEEVIEKPAASEKIIEKVVYVELPPEEQIWIETMDYTLMTKSQIQVRISSLNELIEIIKQWPSMKDIHEQALIELELANTHLKENNYLYPYTDEDFLLLSYMIYIEAGASLMPDEERCLVGCVILNRRNNNGVDGTLDNPTIKDIINEAGQYAICNYDATLKKNTFYVDIDTVDMSKVTDQCRECARIVLEGEYTCPPNVLYQALFVQGEIYKSFYHGAPFYNTTYICYGD
jgi:hypothetical protein